MLATAGSATGQNRREPERGLRTWPERASLLGDEADVLRAFLHLAGQVEGRGKEEIGVGAADLDLCVESLDVDLSGGDGLLADGEALGEAVELWIAAGQSLA